MQITDTQIAQFQTLFKNKFGKQISREEALEKGISLVLLMKLIYKPITKKEQQNILTRQKALKD